MSEESFKRGSRHNLPDEEAAGLNLRGPGGTSPQPGGPTESAKVVTENDDDKVPPNLDKCEIHRRAKKVYAVVPGSEKAKVRKICDCCGNAYDLEPLSLCCAKSEFYHLGAGFPLYFDFIIFCAVLIVIMIAISGVYNFVTNLNNKDCETNISLDRDNLQFCDPNKITITSLVNKRFSEKELEISNWLNLGTVIIMIISFHFFRRQSRLTAQEVDNSAQTPADFTIEIKNLPLDATDEEIKNFIEKELFNGDQDKKIVDGGITRGFNIGPFVKLQRRKNAIQLELNKGEVKNRAKLENELADVKTRLAIIEKNIETELEPTPFAFVTFEREEDAREALKRLGFDSIIKKLFFELGCYGCFEDLKFRGTIKLDVHRAPEPSDIIWENLGITESQQRRRRFVSFIVSLILILLCGGVIILINVGKARLSNPKDLELTKISEPRSVGTEFISIAIGLVIMFINNSINYSTRIFAAYESRSTYTSYFVSVAQRLAFTTFINTTITLLVTNYILNTLWKNGGLVNDVFVVYIINAVLGPLLCLLDPFYFWRLWQRRSIRNQGEKCLLTQKEANLIFEGPAIDMAQMYGIVVKTLWATAFFAPLLPISIPIPLIGLFFTYWVDKYLLLRRYAKPTELGKGLSVWMTELLEFTPFIFAAGNIIFRKLILSDDLTIVVDASVLPSILAIAISAASAILPWNNFLKICGKGESTEDCKRGRYSAQRSFFNNDYKISNPVYHEEALESWLKTDNQNNPVIEKAIQDQANRGKDEVGKNVLVLKNLKGYAKKIKGIEPHKNPMYAPAPPNQAMVLYKVNDDAAKMVNFYMDPNLYVPKQGVTQMYPSQPGPYPMNSISHNPHNIQLNFDSNRYPPQPHIPQGQLYPQLGQPQYPPPQYSQNLPQNYIPQYPMSQNQPFVPPHGNPQAFYPQDQAYPPNGQYVQMIPMNNGGVYQNNNNPYYQRHFPDSK